ncbi:MAG: UDP-N-acetylmuramate dehydrogenase [Peptococcaceae bacterium]|nr:UDP-N-acetylmuramate dehydrogenase [Peptococcaceae bacterium]
MKLTDIPSMETNANLRTLNTFGLPAQAKHLLRIQSLEEARQAQAYLAQQPEGLSELSLILGGGSNLVLKGDPLRIVLKVEIPGRRRLETNDTLAHALHDTAGASTTQPLLIEGGAGETWHDFVRWTLDEGWPGLENLSLIPGTVGAAPVQNIGAYGLEAADRIDSLEALDLTTGELKRFDNAACQFGYRDSLFKRHPGRWLITTVRFRLPQPWQPVTHYTDLAQELAGNGFDESRPPSPHQISDAVIALRQRKLPDPADLGNAGSFFKNPIVDAKQCATLLTTHPTMPHHQQPDGRIKLSAGWLIEQSGWKGRRLGPVGCHTQHALILVNYGNATGQDVRQLTTAIQQDISRQFGVSLDPEPVFI